MKTISGYVRDVLDESEVALSAMQAGFLNLSAYAKTIQGEVSKRARRDVAVGSSSQQFLHLDGLTSFQSGEWSPDLGNSSIGGGGDGCQRSVRPDAGNFYADFSTVYHAMGALAPELRLAAGGGNQAATNLIEKKILELPGLGRDIDVLLGHYYTTATRALDGIRIGITPDELAQRHAAWEATYIRGIIVAALADQFSQSQLPTSALDAADAFDRTHLRYGEVHRRPS